MLRLKHTKPLISGANRRVFQHPDNEGWLVKVIREDVVENFRNGGPTKRKKGRSYNYPRRHGIYTSFFREIDEYLAIKARFDEPILCIQPIFGIVETDLGLGLVVEKLRGRDGNLAPTLLMLVRTFGFTHELRTKFNEYIDMIISRDIVTSDFHPNNIVYASDEMHGERFVLVDGLGEKALIPVNKYSRLINRRSNLRRSLSAIRKLERLELPRQKNIHPASKYATPRMP